MKKSAMIVIAAAAVLSLASVSYGKYEQGYKVIQVSENQVTIQQADGEPIVVTVDKNKFNIGDAVKYDADKLKIRPAKNDKKDYPGC